MEYRYVPQIQNGRDASRAYPNLSSCPCGEPGTPVQAALMAVDKMITEEKPDAIVVAPFRSEAMVATLDLIAKYKMVTIQTIAQTPKLIEIYQGDPEKYKYWFRATTNSIHVGTVAAKTMDSMRTQFKYDKFFIIAQDTLWARAAADAAKKALEESLGAGNRPLARFYDFFKA